MIPGQIIRSHSLQALSIEKTQADEFTEVKLQRTASLPNILGTLGILDAHSEIQPLESFQMIPQDAYQAYIDTNIVNEEQVHQMHHDWGEAITDTLLNTPAMLHKLNSEHPRPLNEVEWRVLKNAAQELLIQKTLNPHAPLQLMADALVGKTYNLSSIADLKKVLLKTVNQLAQSEISLKENPSDGDMPLINDRQPSFDTFRLKHLFKKTSSNSSSSSQKNKSLPSSTSGNSIDPPVSETKQALVLLLKTKLSDMYPLEVKESALQAEWEALRFHDGDTDPEEISQIETALKAARKILAEHTKEKQSLTKDLMGLGMPNDAIQNIYEKNQHEQNQHEIINDSDSFSEENSLQEKFSEGLNQLKEKISHLNEKASVEDLSSLADDFSSLEKTISHESHEAILLLLSDQLRHSATHALKQEIKQSFCQQLKCLNDSGSEQEINLRFAMGTAIGKAIGVELLKGRLEFNYRFNIQAHDDNRVRTQHLLTPRVSVSMGDKKLFQGGLSAAYEMKLQSKSLKSVEEFAEVYADDILTRLAVLLPSAHKDIVKTSRVFARVRQQEKLSIALANTELSERLRQSGILHSGDSIQLTPTRAPNFSFGYHKPNGVSGMEYRADFTTCAGILKGSYSRSNIANQFMKHAGLLSTLLADDSRVERYSKKNFSVLYPEMQNNKMELSFFQGKVGYEKLEAVRSQIQKNISLYNSPTITAGEKENSLSSLLNNRSNIKIAIAGLYEEFDHYCAVVNKKDGFNLAKELHGWSSSVKSQMAEIKHSFEKSRTANGRGQFLRSVFITHAKLVSLYHQTFVNGARPETEDAGFSELLMAIRKDYELPQLHLEQSKHINKQLTLITEGTSIHKTQVLQLAIGNQDIVGASIKPRVSLFSVDHYNNPDMNGEFVSFRVSLGVGVKIDEAIQKLVQEINGSQILNSKDSNDLSLDNIDWQSFLYNVEGEVIVEAEWVKHQPVDSSIADNDKPTWRLEYVRLLGAGSVSALTPSLAIPTGALDVTISAGVSLKNTYALKEWIGFDTIKYIQTKYNGWQAANKISKQSGASQEADAWGVFQAAHKKEFESIYKQLSNSQSNISKEVSQRLFDLTDTSRLSVKKLETALANISKNERSFNQVDDFSSYFFEVMQSFKENPQEPEYHQAHQAMRLFLTLQNVEHEEDAARSYTLRKK